MSLWWRGLRQGRAVYTVSVPWYLLMVLLALVVSALVFLLQE